MNATLNNTFLPSKDRQKQILSLALPIILSMLSINLIGIIDTAMVGQLGNHALAAIGFGSFSFWCCLSIFIGIGSAIQSKTAYRFGANLPTAPPLTTGLIMIMPIGFILTCMATLWAQDLMLLFSRDLETVHQATGYFQFRSLSILGVGLSIGFRGFWNGIKQPHIYMIILVGTHIINILLNWILIYGKWGFPPMESAGAGIASSIATWLGVIFYFAITYHHHNDFLANWPPKANMLRLLKLGTPLAIDQVLFAGSYTCFMGIIGHISTQYAAIANVITTIILLLWLPGLAFGISSLTLVSETLGKGRPEQARQWAWDVSKIAALTLIAISIPLWIWPQPLLSLFIQDPTTLQLTILPLRMDLGLLWFNIVGIILLQSLIGTGASQTVMWITFLFQWILFLPICWLLQHYNLPFIIIWLVSLCIPCIKTLVLIIIWKNRNLVKHKHVQS